MIDTTNFVNSLNISAALTLIALLLFFIFLVKFSSKRTSKK